MSNPLEHPMQASIDGGVAVIIFTSFVGILPALAAIIGICYYGIQVWESNTVQTWVHARKAKHAAKKLAILRNKQQILLAEIDAAELVRSASVEAHEKVAAAHLEAVKVLAKGDPQEVPTEGGNLP